MKNYRTSATMSQAQQSQPQQQQQPSVVIVQQPVYVANGTLAPRGVPHLRRGVRLKNGIKLGPRSFIGLGFVSAILLIMGLSFLSSRINIFLGIMMLIFGGGLLALLVKFCQKAKQDYDALPFDHPDRAKYTTLMYTPHGRGGGMIPLMTQGSCQMPPGTQVIPPGAQVITSPATVQGGQVITNYQLPPGAQIIAGSQVIQSGAFSSQNPVISQFPEAVASNKPYSPEDDKPPSYDEVLKQSRES